MKRVYLSLGSNINPMPNLITGIDAIRQRALFVAASKFYTTSAVGEGQGEFINVAIAIDTPLDYDTLKSILRQIEDAHGRDHSQKATVTLDIDIILYGDEEPDPDLYRYTYIALPLADIAPSLRLPTGETMRQLAARLQQEEAE